MARWRAPTVFDKNGESRQCNHDGITALFSAYGQKKR